MSQETQNVVQKIIFEGAGWSGAEHNGVGNCRIRGVFTRTDGKHLYLEMSGTKNHSHMAPSIRHMDFPGHVWHCFLLDDPESNISQEVRWVEREWRQEYTTKNIVALLNRLGVKCESFEVDNWTEGHCTGYSPFTDSRYIEAQTRKLKNRR